MFFGAMMAAVALQTAGAAAAAVPWSAPRTIEGAYTLHWVQESGGWALRGVPSFLGFTSDGAGVALLGREAGGWGRVRYSAAQQALGPIQPVSLAGVAPTRMATYGGNGVLIAGAANRASDRRGDYPAGVLLDAAVARGTVTGAFGRRQVLGQGLNKNGSWPAQVAALAANPAGDMAVVISQPHASRVALAGFKAKLFVLRHGGQRFHFVMDLGRMTRGSSPAALALTAAGDVLVAWDDRRSVSAALVRGDGRIGKPQRLGEGGSALGGDRIAAAIDARRRMLVAWLAQSISTNDYAGGPGVVGFAYAPPAGRFRHTQIVQRNLPRGYLRGVGGAAVQVALLRKRGVVAWSGFSNNHYAVRSTEVVDGRASQQTEISPPGVSGQLRGLAAGPAGGATLTWVTGGQRKNWLPKPPLTLHAAVRTATSTSWGPTEDVATTDAAAVDMMASDASTAVDPASGQAVSLFSDPLPPPAGATPPLAPVAVRYAVRPAATTSATATTGQRRLLPLCRPSRSAESTDAVFAPQRMAARPWPWTLATTPSTTH